MPSRKKPRKPTEPYGYIQFGKDGKVSKQMSELSQEKGIQEYQVVEAFASHFPNPNCDHSIVSIKPLPQADHDAVIRTSTQQEISVQLTEIVARQFMSEISLSEYQTGAFKTVILREPDSLPLAVDEAKRDEVLASAIRKKHEKRYAKAPDEILWLVVFSTAPSLWLVAHESGRTKTSTTYDRAVSYVGEAKDTTFDMIWFFDLRTTPVRVWPEPTVSTLQEGQGPR